MPPAWALVTAASARSRPVTFQPSALMRRQEIPAAAAEIEQARLTVDRQQRVHRVSGSETLFAVMAWIVGRVESLDAIGSGPGIDVAQTARIAFHEEKAQPAPRGSAASKSGVCFAAAQEARRVFPRDRGNLPGERFVTRGSG